MQIDPKLLFFIFQHRNDDPTRLLLSKAPEGVDLRLAVQQIEIRRRLRDKLPLWVASDDCWFPSRLAAEQCSSQLTAQYKASLVEPIEQGCDLTGGMGVDSSLFSIKADRWHYVERHADYCVAAAHNFASLGLNNIETHTADALAFLSRQPIMDFVYLDPARRGEGDKRLFELTDYEPDILSLLSQIERLGARFMIKVSPMADLTQLLRQLPCVERIDVVSFRNECKEILLSGCSQATGEPTIHCINLLDDQRSTSFAFTFSEERSALPRYTSTLETYLYEPDSSILKAGAFNTLASRFDLNKLHPNSHLYTSSLPVERFNGRGFTVREVIPFTSASLKRTLPCLKKANITCRNFPLSVAELRNRTKLADGGTLYLFATTLSDETPVVVVGEKL